MGVSRFILLYVRRYLIALVAEELRVGYSVVCLLCALFIFVFMFCNCFKMCLEEASKKTDGYES